MVQALVDHPAEEAARMSTLRNFAHLVMPLPLGLNLWKVQNAYWEMCQKILPEFNQRAAAGDEQAQAWLEDFFRLGETLGFAVDRLKNLPTGVKLAAA